MHHCSCQLFSNLTIAEHDPAEASKWHTFDCVVVVMDGRQGVNTDEQVNLLELVKENQKNRELPVIILCNKIDVPEDVQQQVLVEEARDVIEKEFNVANSLDRLKEVLSVTKESKGVLELGFLKEAYPLFITISAVHAFIYQSASIMPLEDFEKFDFDLIERFGRDYFGRKWRQLDKSKKYAKAYKALKDPEECKVGLELSNFDKFLAALDYTVGGKQRQLCLMKEKLEDATTRLGGNETLVGDLEQIVLKRKSLKVDEVDDLHSKFWSLLEEAETSAFVEFENPTKVGSLAVPMTLLLEYHGLCTKFGWREQCDLVVCGMKHLLRRQFSVIFEKWSKCWRLKTREGCFSRDCVFNWEDLLPKGWETLLSLMLLMDERPFRMNFGREKIALESMLYQCRSEVQIGTSLVFCPDCEVVMKARCRTCTVEDYIMSKLQHKSCSSFDPKYYHCTQCDYYFDPTRAAALGRTRHCPRGCTLLSLKNNECSGGCNFRRDAIGIPYEAAGALDYKDGAWTPMHPKCYNRLNGIAIPKDGVAEPDHFGHLLWQFCNLMEDNQHQSMRLKRSIDSL